MSFGGFLQGLGLQYGRSLMYGQEFEKQKAQTDLLKSEALIEGTRAQQMQQQIKTQKDLADFISSQQQLDGKEASQPLEQARMYQKASGIALQHGDMQSAKEMMDMSRQASQDAQTQVVTAAKQQAMKNEAVGTSAQAYADNPTPEGFNDVVRKAIAAGVNPSTIPVDPNSAEGKAWINTQKLAGMTSKERAEFTEKTADIKARRDEQIQNHRDNIALREATLQQTASYRDAMIGLRREEISSRADKAPKTIDVAGATYEYDPQGQVKGDRLASDSRYVKLGQKITATQENNTVALGGAAAEAARNIKQMANFHVGTANSPFQHLGDHTFVDALSKTATNALTNEQIQMFQTSSAGLALELSRVATIGAGRGANQSVINEMQKLTTPTAGDTNLTMAYKLSTAAQIALTRMEATPPPSDQSAASKWQETQSFLKSLPTPEQIQNVAGTKEGHKLASINHTYAQAMVEINKQTGQEGLPGTPDVGAGTKAPPLPAGWSVVEH
jgi:hypothetical protein